MEEVQLMKIVEHVHGHFSSMKLLPVPGLLSFSFRISKESNKSVGYREQRSISGRSLEF